MRLAHGNTAPVPSSSLLRFLRSQSQEVCFFTPSSSTIISRQSTSRSSQSIPSLKGFELCSSSTRGFATSLRRHASVEASLLNLEFLRPSTQPEVWSPPAQGPTRQHPNLKSSTLLDNLGRSRHISTRFRPLFERLWGLNGRKSDVSLKPTDFPPLPSFVDDASGVVLGRSKAGKASNELKLRCTEFNANGDATIVNGEFKKTELIAKVGLRITVSLLKSPYFVLLRKLIRCI